MRPGRFETFLRELLEQEGQVKEVQTVSEAGYGRFAYGLVVTYTNGARVLTQHPGMARPGDRGDGPEAIIEGAAPERVPVPEVFSGGRLDLSVVDRHLLAVILNSGSREIEGGDAYSTRKEPQAVPFGCTIRFHDGSRIYVYLVHALPPGRDGWPSAGHFRLPAAA